MAVVLLILALLVAVLAVFGVTFGLNALALAFALYVAACLVGFVPPLRWPPQG